MTESENDDDDDNKAEIKHLQLWSRGIIRIVMLSGAIMVTSTFKTEGKGNNKGIRYKG